MKNHFEQAIAFDRDNPLNQRVGLGKKYNELVDEYNALEAKLGATPADEVEDVQSEETQEATDEAPAEETVLDGATTDDQPSVDPAEEEVDVQPADDDASADEQATEEVEDPAEEVESTEEE